MSFRLLIHPKMEGRLAMAVDEALIEAVGAARSGPVARLYGFSPATLSLGRFQPVSGRIDRDLLEREGVVLVRRPTGGHAVLHDDELTYSIILSKEEAERRLGSFRKRAVYEFVAGLLLKGLENLGIKATMNETRRGDIRNPDCFATAGEYEISTMEGKKLIGSAQMTTRHAILQQGSIPIANPLGQVTRYISGDAPGSGQSSGQGSEKGSGPSDPRPASSLSEEAGRAVGFEEARDAFAKAFRESLGAVDSTLAPEEKEAAWKILGEKYANDSWTLKH